MRANFAPPKEVYKVYNLKETCIQVFSVLMQNTLITMMDPAADMHAVCEKQYLPQTFQTVHYNKGVWRLKTNSAMEIINCKYPQHVNN